jgi:hypothetical protein
MAHSEPKAAAAAQPGEEGGRGQRDKRAPALVTAHDGTAATGEPGARCSDSSIHNTKGHGESVGQRFEDGDSTDQCVYGGQRSKPAPVAPQRGARGSNELKDSWLEDGVHRKEAATVLWMAGGEYLKSDKLEDSQ